VSANHLSKSQFFPAFVQESVLSWIVLDALFHARRGIFAVFYSSMAGESIFFGNIWLCSSQTIKQAARKKLGDVQEAS